MNMHYEIAIYIKAVLRVWDSKPYDSFKQF